MKVGVFKPLLFKSSWLYISVLMLENIIFPPISSVLNSWLLSFIVNPYGYSTGDLLFLILLDLLNLLFPLTDFFLKALFNLCLSASSPFISPSGGLGNSLSAVSVTPAPWAAASFSSDLNCS